MSLEKVPSLRVEFDEYRNVILGKKEDKNDK
jgi:hypothetical protein